MTLVKDGQFRGRVLDVGCGTGDNALHLAFNLTDLGQVFDTILDSAFLHILGNTATYRRPYIQQLAAVLRAGGWVHLLEISERATGPFPSITNAEIVDAFDHKWINAQIQHATYAVTTGEVPAWLVSIQRR